MKSRWLALSLLGGTLALGGCNTYHYFDIKVDFGSVGIEQAGVLQLCHLDVSGADSHSADLPSSAKGESKTVCPVASNWPIMGTFEFSTFADSGSITFNITAFKDTVRSTDNLCTSGSLTMNAAGEITQMGMLTMGAFDDAKCPNNVVHP
jgi:hypothetical protein